jgi:hypothetical protein
MEKNTRIRRLYKTRAARKKNFLPTLIITFLLWSIFAFFVYFIDPEIPLALFFFFLLLFASCVFIFSLIFGNSRRGFIVSLAITVFMILRYFGVGNLLNLILILAAALTFEIYFSRRT